MTSSNFNSTKDIPLVPEGPGFASEDSGMQCKAQNVDGSLTPSRLRNAAMRPQDRSQDSIFRYEGYISPYQLRRQHLISLMKSRGGGIAVIPTAPEVMRNKDADYPYRHDSYFYYLSGFSEPEATLVLIAGADDQAILFCRSKDVEQEIWQGFRYGPEAAQSIFEFDLAYASDTLEEMLPTLMHTQSNLFIPWAIMENRHESLLNQVPRWLKKILSKSRDAGNGLQAIIDIHPLLDEMRLFKDNHEVALMKKAAKISTAAHRRAMKHTRPDMYEYEIEAELLHEFRRQGSDYPAYGSIVASGANACILHYRDNHAQLKPGDLLLIDAGCEFGSYASDITRTFPINGKFSEAQASLYNIVLAAQQAAIDVTLPGYRWDQAHEAAVRVLSQGLIDEKILFGSLDEVLESKSYRQFYMHRTGHWLGMDVHDVGVYLDTTDPGNSRILQPGMVTTVEPGLYIRPNENIPQAFWNIGIRIEDDVLITDKGNEVLTADAPKTIADIEAVMQKS